VNERYAARFWARVDKSGDGCWPWLGAANTNGYGILEIGGGRRTTAHRVARMLAMGEIPEGLFVCHRCDNPGCMRPDHLFLGTPGDNMRDKAAKGRGNAPTGERHGAHTQPDRILRGEARPQAKLTTADVAEIRRRGMAGDAKKAIARDYGVAPRTVRDVVRRRRWAHVP
jgi:hypothetical protein